MSEVTQQPEAPVAEGSDPSEVVQEPETQSGFQEMVGALIQAQAMLARGKQFSNPSFIKQFLQNDVLPIMIDTVKMFEWYVMDLNERLQVVEQNSEEGAVYEGIDPETGQRLIEFIGKATYILGQLAPLIQQMGNQELLLAVQELILSSPGLIAKVQDLIAEEDEEEGEEVEDDEDEEIPEVLEPLAPTYSPPQRAMPSPSADLRSPSAPPTSSPAGEVAHESAVPEEDTGAHEEAEPSVPGEPAAAESAE